MAKAKRRWLVRDDNGFFRMIKRERTPHKPVSGWKNFRGHPNYVCKGCVGILLPESFHLEPGGGPVELPG